jgi:PHD/YefM family antitoxin component YafN of YafNO toxin-antitoxin module
VKVISSRDLNQDVSQAKRAARLEPVFVTDRGKPTHVLMSIQAFRQLAGHSESIVDLLAMPGLAGGEAEPERRAGAWDRREGLR